jgi:T5SS/PEP-CTERM-associated repeat protein
MADDLQLVFFGAWNDPNWIDITAGATALVPAGAGNDLDVDLGTGGTMTGSVSADGITVVPGILGPVAFTGGTVDTQFFQLSENPEGSNLLSLSDGVLSSTDTLIVGQNTTLEVDSGATLIGPTGSAPGLQDFGTIEVNGGTVTSTEMDVFATLEFVGGTGMFTTLVVGSYTGEGGFGGVGELTIDATSSVDVSGVLAIAAQQGTGTINVNGGTLTIDGDADVGEADAGGLTVSAGGSMSVSGSLDIGTSGGGTGTLSVQGSGSTLSADGGLTIGDAGTGTGTIGDSATVSVDGTLVIGETGTGAATVTGGSLSVDGMLIVGGAGSGTLAVGGGAEVSATGESLIEIGATAGASGSIDVSGASASLSGQKLDVGGTGISAGGSGVLSIGSGGSVDVLGATVWNSGQITLSGGILSASPVTVDGALSGYGTVDGTIDDDGQVTVNGGLLVLTGGIAGTGTLAFQGTASLAVGAPGTIGISLPVTGLADGDRIELGGLTIESAALTSPGTITVTTTSTPFVLSDVTFAAGASHILTTGSDAVSGEYYFQVACFAAGTRIAVPRGDVAVEDLRAGENVLLAAGGVAEVRWIGRRTIDARRHPDPRRVWPVRIAADAFGAGRPHRDLFLSPDHAVFVEDVLIPVKHLINGQTIVQVAVDAVTYYHVELPRHDVVLAEGLPVESYLDIGDRRDFANGGTAVRLHPDLSARAWGALGYAPLIVTGPELDRARRLVEAHAVAKARAA